MQDQNKDTIARHIRLANIYRYHALVAPSPQQARMLHKAADREIDKLTKPMGETQWGG